jgi:hypothetical protein
LVIVNGLTVLEEEEEKTLGKNLVMANQNSKSRQQTNNDNEAKILIKIVVIV